MPIERRTYPHHSYYIPLRWLIGQQAQVTDTGSWVTVALALGLIAAVGVLVTWGRVYHAATHARRSIIDHAAGDGALATWASAGTPLGTSVTRPAEQRPGPPRRP